jgi:serine/threonine protein kinase
MYPSHVLKSGCHIGKYQIQHVLGAGGFGITYLAAHVETRQLFAIKEYFPTDLAVREVTTVHPKAKSENNNFAQGLERFIEEAKVLTQFSHPYIIKAQNFFTENNTAYLVMDYARGRSLEVALDEGQIAEPIEILLILPALLDSLNTVHQAGLLHRDIKPANIYLRDTDNMPILLDFGSARYDVSKCSRPLTSIVTHGYAPHEQYVNDLNWQGKWTDIYAMGAVLYRLITGVIPASSPQRASAKGRNDHDPLIPISTLCKKKYPANLIKGIEWALQVMEKDRPQSIFEWKEVIFDVNWYCNAAKYGSQHAKSWLEYTIQHAKEGDAECQFMLGKIYEYGYCFSKNMQSALYWYSLSAQKGFDFAKIRLSQLHQQGIKVDKNLILCKTNKNHLQISGLSSNFAWISALKFWKKNRF